MSALSNKLQPWGFLAISWRSSTRPSGSATAISSRWPASGFWRNDPTYKALLRRVWLWNEWPGRRGIDAGIDLVAEDHDGKRWAIAEQAALARRMRGTGETAATICKTLGIGRTTLYRYLDPS
jgi:hypothetical protein